MRDENIIENEIEVPTPDGVADAVLYRWPEGRHPGIVHYPDGIGLRPSQRQMARRVAAEGYDVLIPNIYYRVLPSGPGLRCSVYTARSSVAATTHDRSDT